MLQKKDIAFEAFRGLAIIAVVAIHTTGYNFTNIEVENNFWNFDFFIVYRQLFNFAVPSFIFISGYWISKKSIDSFEDYKYFLKKRLSKIFVPYLFWSVIFLCFYFRKNSINPFEIFFKLITGGALSPYYFIILIAQLYILTPVIQIINRRLYGVIFILLINIGSLLSLYLFKLWFNINLPFQVYALPFYSWIIFYEMGLILEKKDLEILDHLNLFSILLMIIVGFLISVFEARLLLITYSNLEFAVSAIKFSSFFYSMCIIFGFLFTRKRLEKWPKVLTKVGSNSFGIFLIHIPILYLIELIVKDIKIVISFPLASNIFVVLSTIFVCYNIIEIIKKLLPNSLCTNILGF